MKLKYVGYCTIKYDDDGQPYFTDRDNNKHYIHEYSLYSGPYKFTGYSGQSYFSAYFITIDYGCEDKVKCYYGHW